MTMCVADTCIGHVKRKTALEHVQNVHIQIILRICKASSGPVLTMHSVVYNDLVSGQ